MTSQHSDPNFIDLDEFQFDTPATTPATATTATIAPNSTGMASSQADTDAFSEFSFEDLMALEELPHPATHTPPQPSAVQSQPMNAAPLAPETLTSETLTSGAGTTQIPATPTAINHADLDFNFDDEISHTPAAPTTAEPTSLAHHDPFSTLDNPSDTPFLANSLDTPATSNSDFSTAAGIAGAGIAGAGMAGATMLGSQTNTPAPTPASAPAKKIFGLSLGKPKQPKSVQPPTQKAPSKGFFNKKPTPPKSASLPANTPPTLPPNTPRMVKTKKNNLLPLILLAAIAALAAGWWFLTQSEPEPTPAPAPVAKKTTPTPMASATPATPVVANASAPLATVTAATATATSSTPAGTITNSSVSTTTTTTNTATPSLSKTTVIKPEDITAPALPADNATAKEEMDRLGQQSKQLEEQEKMMEEQLKMMNELSSKKEERIAILEKQIAQIEAQKGTAKK